MRGSMKVGALAIAAALLLSGCTTDQFAQDYRDGGNKNYVAGDGSILEVPPGQRDKPIVFDGESETGEAISSADYLGQVLVVNFWAGYCAPCRVEAPMLQELSTEWAGKGAAFVGVNTYDEPENAQAFARTYGVTYPSLIDAKSGAVQLAFAGKIPPSALPTTIVLDAQGRVAARILGQLEAASILDAIVKTVIAEDG